MSTTIRSDRMPAVSDHDTRVGPPGQQPALPGAEFPFFRPPAAPGEIGRIGNYRVLKLLGTGGMGKVFLAEDLALKRDVALKVMCLSPGEDILAWRERFLREARSLAAIKHPNLVTVYQVGEDRGTVFLAMELLEGEALDARIRREAPLSVSEILRVADEIATGLVAIHDRGLIHRDIKPANIWLTKKDDSERMKAEVDTEPMSDAGSPFIPHPSSLTAVKILDFGLVREVKSDTQLTESGVVVGTPAYMSPEQVRGRPLDYRTDLFSFGCVLYAMCTGRSPFAASNPMAQAVALATEAPIRVQQLNPTVPAAFSDLIAELLAKNPEDRPSSAAEVRARLRAISTKVEPQGDEPSRRSFLRRHALKFVILVWVVAAALAAVALTRHNRPAGGNDQTSPPASQPPIAVVEYLHELPKLDEFVFPRPGSPRPPGMDGTVRVGGVHLPHSIYMHAAPGFGPPAFAAYSLDKKYSRFTTEVALNDSAGKWTGVIFVVSADGKHAWSSGNISSVGQKETCDLNVRGVNVLRLEVRPMGPHPGAHGVWIDPRLTK